MIVKEIIYNWHQKGSLYNESEAGEDWYSACVGANDVVEIEEHPARGEDDLWSYLVKYKDGKAMRIFNPNTVFYTAE